MEKVKKIVGEYTNIMRKIHTKKAHHGRLKTNNLFINTNEDGEDEYMVGDVGPFSNELSEEYMSPE